MTWLEDVIQALVEYGGEARWSEILATVNWRRYSKGLHMGHPIHVWGVLNKNRDGQGRDLFTKVARGVYKLKSMPPAPPTLASLDDYTEEIEQEEILQGIAYKRRILQDFHGSLELPDANESKASAFLKEETWILGLQYVAIHPELRLGLRGRTDFLLEKVGGDFDIVELKHPNARLFVTGKSHEERSWSADLKDAISQMMYYLSRSDTLYHFQREEAGMDVLHPTGIIVIGRLSESDAETLRIHNNFLNRIRIVTYDHLLQEAEVALNEIEGA